ncbi:MAG: RluA family pseudouridine synthase [Planctomycetes bacterium]|nr:RluA family pseudouridine synthase [Planctomycetota bacterium]
MIPRFPGDRPRDLGRPLELLRLAAADEHDGERLDRVLSMLLHWRSRTSVHRLIRDGFVELDGRRARPASRIRRGETIVVRVPPDAQPDDMFPDDFDVPILHEDRHFIALDKPAGMAVHPAGRITHGTLIHALHKRYRRPDDPAHDVVPRLLHRIDRETSGVIAVGLDERFHLEVRKQFEERSVQKAYLAVVHGRPDPPEGRVEYGIGPDRGSPIRLKLEARRDGSGLPACTRYRVVRGNDHFSLVELHPETGRTHQLRVHMEALGCPLVGDKIYGVPPEVFLENLDGELSTESRAMLILDRQALHAHRLAFVHPFTGREVVLEAPLPVELERLVTAGRTS